MGKKKIGVILGGMSTENKVSVVSGTSVLKNLNRDKYEIYPIFISEEGKWYEYDEGLENVSVDSEVIGGNPIENICDYLKNMDVIFPVLHGLYGEDGTIQGLLELLKIPYVGCRVLASSVGMDKVYSKIVFSRAGLEQATYVYIRKYNEKYIYVSKNFEEQVMDLDGVCSKALQVLKFPIFVKPSNSGSSVGVKKATNINELKKCIEYAGIYDKKILLEQGIDAREIECAVLGNEDVISSCTGEVLAAEEFYSFDAKYKNAESRTVIPADISEKQESEIRKLAVKAFKAIDGKGLSRVDFFIEKGTNKIYINEINTLPGFTNISMYPKLFGEVGIGYSELLDRLIDLAY